ncbi:collagen alpha-6(VI) chain-like [Dreissena polymorpha]|uniref:collagen alpha-6(VI) chain-like n=1 Tax=Dreissena polymorpha TaxID=45954 RepID=UPI00226505D1|nr:collagen alpha-6(VI) chain-like [Dreissena polymorpha]
MGGRTWLVVAVVMVALLSDVIDAQRAPGFPEYSDIGSNPVDIVFVVDTSAFNNETAEDEIVVKAFIAGFLDNADVDSGAVKAAFITYSTHPKVVFDLDDYSNKSEMVNAVYISEFEEGERNTADALGKVRSQILRQDRPDVPNVIVLIMTGASDRNSFRTLQESDALKVARSTIFVIGVNLDEDGTNELNQLASKPTIDHSFQVTSFSEFDILKDVLFVQIFDWAEQAYNVPATGTESLDVAFLLHFSHTMTSTAHDQILGFMKSVLQYSGLDGDKVKVGAAILRKKGTVLFDLNAHSGQEEVFEAIDKISYTYRSKPANFASGFDTVRTSLFTESRGDRAEVPNLIILITDANSNEDVGGTITAVEKAKAAGAAVFVVGVNVSYAEEMTSVASSSGFTVLVNDTKYLKDQAMTLYDSFVALRTEGFPVVIPAEQTSLTIPAFETTTPMTTANSEEVDLVIAVHVRHDTKLKYVKKHLQALLKDITDKLDIDSGAVRVALVTFGKSTTVNIKLKDHTDSKKLQKALKNVNPKQYRSKGVEFMQLLNTLETTVLLESEGDRKDVPNLLLIISDGKSDEDARSLSQRSVGMKTKNNTIFAVGINGADAAEISSLATEPVNKHSFMGKTYDDLTTSGDLQRKLKESFKIFEKLAIPSSTDTKDNNDKNPKGTAKQTKPPKPTKTPKPSAGVTKAKAITKKSNTIAEFVTLSTSRRQQPSTSTRAPDVTNVIPELTFLPAIPLSDSNAADLVIAIHLSDRVSQGEFAVVQEFLKNIVATTDVESGKVQLGMIFYGVDPELLFHINQYTSIELIQKEIDGLTIDQRSATADASAALGLVRQMLTPMHGRRDDIPAAAVFLTNQASNENNEFLIEAKRRLVEDEIEVFALGIGMKDKSELVNLASKQANVMNYDNVWMLNDAEADLQTKIRACT